MQRIKSNILKELKNSTLTVTHQRENNNKDENDFKKNNGSSGVEKYLNDKNSPARLICGFQKIISKVATW